MIDDAFVIDGVIHSYNLSQANWKTQDCETFVRQSYEGLHKTLSPRDEPKWTLDEANFTSGKFDAETMAHLLFAESQSDACVYHGVAKWGLFKDGGSPLDIGLEMRRQNPGRVAVYGPIWPLAPNVLEEVDRLVEEDNVSGLKFYPADIIDDKVYTFRMDDADVMFPIFEQAQKAGIKSVAVHKAIPLDRAPLWPYKVDDLDEAFLAFPDLNIEIVHGGFAFLEETAIMLRRFKNAFVNLEGTTGLLPNHPKKFMDILGVLLATGAEDRIFWGTGAMVQHPQPLIEAFWNLEFPQEFVDGYGIPQLTKERKKKILSGNIARVLELDIEEMKRESKGDQFDQQEGLAEPWSALR